ncbi:hypothetical protein OOT33_14475 [Sphingobium sp. DEHP117]|uniref:hypothetical protein n=1 Tax=Sphingobium sp. DEHP117 TaxID=2993436 RepID=UPI0027D6D2C5|nr:hypothetical protein [Sphingobium sp. DEHP117]MDQ4421630.1 hypothetical protein [Sphingobium sp. DEHP117]
MTRLTIRRGGTKRVRATFFVDQSAGVARDLTGLALMVIDQSPNIAPPALTILSPATGGQIEVLWTDEQTAPLAPGAGRVWLTLGFENDTGEREVLPTLTFDVE